MMTVPSAQPRARCSPFGWEKAADRRGFPTAGAGGEVGVQRPRMRGDVDGGRFAWLGRRGGGRTVAAGEHLAHVRVPDEQLAVVAARDIPAARPSRVRACQCRREEQSCRAEPVLSGTALCAPVVHGRVEGEAVDVVRVPAAEALELALHLPHVAPGRAQQDPLWRQRGGERPGTRRAGKKSEGAPTPLPQRRPRGGGRRNARAPPRPGGSRWSGTASSRPACAPPGAPGRRSPLGSSRTSGAGQRTVSRRAVCGGERSARGAPEHGTLRGRVAGEGEGAPSA